MKSLGLTLIAAAAIAYSGAFFEVWEVPVLGDDPLTFSDVGERVGHFFDFTDDLREIREELREESTGRFVTTP